ncbi:BCS1 N terminal-domain-containing protein [Lasiosphaeris hirsuta]|uniref:BCS1 N terminal-domain-containing protein n=1 Tax=Lasiosphaeris hirsuta TaxID=260670 RepID=A0AA40DIA8_9PEZI|nr:BCS1 N terminal-domain-containing protein [Lasiosphaeris hirsuta]
MNSLLTLAGTTLLGGGSATYDQWEDRIPGFGVLQNFLKTWLKVDITTLLTVAALLGAASSGAQSIQDTVFKLYWWIIRFLTASISVAGNDRLNREVLNWLGAHVLAGRGTRILTAKSETVQTDAWHWRQIQERNDYHHEKRVPVQYLPTFGITWFIHDRNIFMVRRIMTNSSHTSWSNRGPDEFSGAPEGTEPLVIMCLGRSVDPIKRFLHVCRDFGDKQREAFVTVRANKHQVHYDEAWDTTILRPLRPLETVHFDEKTKSELVADISNYLDYNTRKFYNGRGIPYRRGYLLHGPPGTGKTSLSLALAGKFGLELYLLHVPSVNGDQSLEKLFTALPPRCIVLLEDIDAVGIKRNAKGDEDEDGDSDEDDEEARFRDRSSRGACTLSGLLNVLDGVASQEGRIVFMTSNHAEKLDKALVRPGRVDRMIFLGNISQRSSELMFLRMYAREGDGPAPAPIGEKTVDPLSEEELERLAREFATKIPDNVFTPAQLQGYLLNYRGSPVDAAANIAPWAKEEQQLMEEAKERARKAAEQKKAKKRAAKLKALAKAASHVRVNDIDSESEYEKLARKMKREDARRAAKSQGKEDEDADQVSGDGEHAEVSQKSKETEQGVNGTKKTVNGVNGANNGVNGVNGANGVNGKSSSGKNGVKKGATRTTNGVVNGLINGELGEVESEAED